MNASKTLPLPQIFVGYCELEDWADAIDPTRPVLALPIDEPGPSVNGIQIDHLVVVCQQVTTEGVVLYCRLRAAVLTRYCGTPLEADWPERQGTLHSLWKEVHSYLSERELTIERATVATPREYALLEGMAKFLRFDPIARRFVRVTTLSGGSETGSCHE